MGDTYLGDVTVQRGGGGLGPLGTAAVAALAGSLPLGGFIAAQMLQRPTSPSAPASVQQQFDDTNTDIRLGRLADYTQGE